MVEDEKRVSDAKKLSIDVSWLEPLLEAVHKRKEANKQYDLCLEMKVRIIMAKRAAQKDLKDRRLELVAAQERLEEAERLLPGIPYLPREREIAVESHAITLGQVWVTYENSHCKKRRALLGKLRSHCVASPHGGDDHMSFLKLFYQQLFVLPLKKAERGHLKLVRHTCAETSLSLAVLSSGAKCTSFDICMKSSQMGDRDYVFEFFWPLSPNPLPLMEALILTLREYLPSFRYDDASGAQLLVVDVENSSSGSGSNPAKIFPKTELSETHKALQETGKKRKSTKGQSELTEAYQYPLTNVEDPEGEEDDLVILAVYKVDHGLFFLPSSTTFESLMEKINLEFELNPAAGTYKIKYQVLPGEWYSLTDGTCLKSYISLYRTSKNINHIKLLVLPVEK